MTALNTIQPMVRIFIFGTVAHLISESKYSWGRKIGEPNGVPWNYTM